MWYCGVNTESSGVWGAGGGGLLNTAEAMMPQAWGWGNTLGSQMGSEGIRVADTHLLFNARICEEKEREKAVCF